MWKRVDRRGKVSCGFWPPKGEWMLIKCLKCLVFMQFMEYWDKEKDIEVYICPNCDVRIGLDFTTEEEAA